MRRFTALSVATLLLHVNLARADLACATHGDRPILAHAQASQSPGEHHAPRGEGPVPAQDDACAVPGQEDCCQAMASCSLNLVVADSAPASRSAQTRSLVTAELMNAPLSRVASPDPPPPRV